MPDVNRHFLAFLAAAALFIPAMLMADQSGWTSQLLIGAATAGFLWLLARRSPIDSRQIICAIVVATTGEIVLSLGWGLYTYQHALIPLYVPFGHGLFYALAAETAEQPLLRQKGATITRAVLLSGTIIAVISLVWFRDQWGMLWWIGAALLILRSRSQLLLSACFVYTMLLEWLGTALGNWQWAAEVPLVGLHSANPPSGVGILYILLDLITVAICAKLFEPQPVIDAAAVAEI